MKTFDEMVAELHRRGGRLTIASHPHRNAIAVRLELSDRYIDRFFDGVNILAQRSGGEMVLRDLNVMWGDLQAAPIFTDRRRPPFLGEPE